MQVRGFVFDGAPEKIVNANCHVVVSSARIRLTCDVSTRNRGGQERRAVRLRGSHLNGRTVFRGRSFGAGVAFCTEEFYLAESRLFLGRGNRRESRLGSRRLMGRPSKCRDFASGKTPGRVRKRGPD